MDKIVKQILETLISKRSFWYSKKGLLVCWTVFLYAYHFASEALTPLLIQLIDHGRLVAILRLSGYLLVLILIAVVWYCSRRLPRFKQNEIGIIFCPHGDEKVGEVISELQERLTQEMDRYRAIAPIRLVALTPNHVVRNIEEAHAMREETNCHVIIWGYLSSAHHGKKEVYNFPQIYFTYKHPLMPLLPTVLLHEKVAEGLKGRKWFIRKDDDFIDLQFLTRNFREISLYIIGLTLFLYGLFEESITIFESLRVDVGNHRGKFKPARYLFINRITSFLREAYLNSAKLEYNKKIFLADKFNIDRNVLKFCIERTSKALSFMRNWLEVHLSAAIFYFLSGDLKKAREHAKEARDYAKSDNLSAPWLSLAFLDLFEGRFDDAISNYDEAFKKITPADTLMGVILFISHIIDLYPTKLQFRFAFGLLNYMAGNETVAKNELRRFIEESQDVSEMSILRNKAQEELSSWEEKKPDTVPITAEVESHRVR